MTRFTTHQTDPALLERLHAAATLELSAEEYAAQRASFARHNAKVAAYSRATCRACCGMGSAFTDQRPTRQSVPIECPRCAGRGWVYRVKAGRG